MKLLIIGKRLVLFYGLACIVFTVFIATRMHNQALMSNAYTYWSNRDSVMGLFFKKWDDRNQQDIWLSGDKTPRWYKIVVETPIFAGGTTNWSEGMQQGKAEEYIRKYVAQGAGIDGRRVKDWLFDIIKEVKYGIYSYDDIFGESETEKDIWRNMKEAQLRQALAYIPIRSYLYAINDSFSFLLAIFPILFGLPLLLAQLICWIIQYLKKGKRVYLFRLTKKTLRFILIISILIGIAYLIRVSNHEYQIQKIVDFVEGKFYHWQMGSFSAVFAFIASFLGLWGIKVVFSLANEEVILAIKNIKNVIITKGV